MYIQNCTFYFVSFTYCDSEHHMLYAMRAHFLTLFIALAAALSEYYYLHQ